LRLKQEDVALQGHAIECRINAEDSSKDFRPSPGTVTAAIFPAGAGIRVDTHIESGVKVPPFYDSLLAKIIVSGSDRQHALRNMTAALTNCYIEGVHTNLALHAALMADPTFAIGGVDTSFLPKFLQGVTRG
jgi:acetyl-CoA carboxylase biotin carboxylase subunit